MRRVSALMVGLVCLLAVAVDAAHAQMSPIVGRWSFAKQYSNGQTAYVLFLTFLPDGRFQEQVMTNSGTVTYMGGYRFDTNQQVLTFVVNDYQPRQLCRYGSCYPVTPALRINSPYVVQVRFESQTRFYMMDQSGPLLFVRQQ